MGKRCELPVKQRGEAVLSLLRREEPGAVIARRYGVLEASLYRSACMSSCSPRDSPSRRHSICATTRDRQIAEFEQQIEKATKSLASGRLPNRILKNSRASPAERGDTFRDHRGTHRNTSWADATPCSGAETGGCRPEHLVPAVAR